MAVKLRRPILIGGVGLSFTLWLLQSINDSVAELGEWAILGLITLGAGFWFFQPRKSSKLELSPVSLPQDRETVQKAIAQAASMITQVQTEVDNQDAITPLQEQIAQLTNELDRQELRLAITGGKSVGKTTLKQLLESDWLPQQQLSISLEETPALFVSNNPDIETEATAQEIALASDLVLFMTTGDLTVTDFQTLQQLSIASQRTILLLNKQDQYLPTQRATVIQQLRQRVTGILAAEDVVAIAAAPAAVKVRQHQPDGSVQEWMEPQNPDLKVLSERLSHILTQERQQLVWASTIRGAAAVEVSAKNVLNSARRDRALPVIEQYQWISAAAAFANPVSALDLLATAAIGAQLIVELGNIYQQKLSLPQAQAAAKALGGLMVKLGLVELSTQTIGSILKTNTLTYVAGGAVQGVSAAYLTRLAGLSLIEYFQEQQKSDNTGQPFNLENLGQKLQKVFQQNQRTAFLQSFVKRALGHLVPTSTQSKLTSSETAATAL